MGGTCEGVRACKVQSGIVSMTWTSTALVIVDAPELILINLAPGLVPTLPLGSTAIITLALPESSLTAIAANQPQVPLAASR